MAFLHKTLALFVVSSVSFLFLSSTVDPFLSPTVNPFHSSTANPPSQLHRHSSLSSTVHPFLSSAAAPTAAHVPRPPPAASNCNCNCNCTSTPPLAPGTNCTCNCNCSNKKKQKPGVNLVSKIINGAFGVLTVGFLITAAVLFGFSVKASFEELPNEPPVQVDDYEDDKKEETQESTELQNPEETQAATELQNPAPQSDAPKQKKKKTRPATKLDKWIKVSDDWFGSVKKDARSRNVYRAAVFISTLTMRIGVPFVTVYFLFHLFWSALETIDSNLHWGPQISYSG